MDDTFFRISIAVLIIAIYIIGVVLYRKYYGKKLKREIKEKTLPQNLKVDGTRILYFWAPGCVQCKSQEKFLDKAIEKLKENGRVLNIKKIDAHKDYNLTKQLNVVTVPTTVLLDEEGEIAFWNPGLISSEKIINQFNGIQKVDYAESA